MIWGLSIQPGDDFTITLDEELCISLAAIESRSKFGQAAPAQAGSHSQLILKTETCEHLLCTLVQGTIFQQCLKLKLMPGEKVTFTVQGSCCIYVTGYSYSSPEGPANGEETVTEEDTTNDGSRNDCNVEVKSQPEDDDCSNGSGGDEETLTNLILAEGRQKARCALSDEGFVQEEQEEWVPDDSSCIIDECKEGKTIFNNPSQLASDLQKATSTCSSLSGEGIVHEGQDESVPDDSSCVMDNSKDKETISDNPLESADGLKQATSRPSSLSGEGIVHEGQDEWVPDDSSCIMDNSKDKETISDNPLESADGLKQATSTCSSLSGEGIVHEEPDEQVPDDSGCIIDNSKDRETVSDNPLGSTDGQQQDDRNVEATLQPEDDDCSNDSNWDEQACNSLILAELRQQGEGIVHEEQDESVPDESGCIINNSKDRETISDNPLVSTDCLQEASSTCEPLSGEGIVHEEQDEWVPDNSGCIIDNSQDAEPVSRNPLELVDGLQEDEESEINSCPENLNHGEKSDNLSGIKEKTWTEPVQQVNELIDDGIMNLETLTPEEEQEGTTFINKGGHHQLSSASCVSNGCVKGHDTTGQCEGGVESCSNSGEQKSATEKPFEDRYCKKEVNLAITVAKHERSHKGKQNFICQDCGGKFRSQANLIDHERVHTGEKPFKCTHCKKKFNQKGNLKVHERIHTGEKPFQCDYCEKSFIQKGNLANHERIHTGKMPFKCNHCGKKFRQKANLVNHDCGHSNRKPSKYRFKCKYCRKQFHSMANCRVHETIHTVEKPYKCDHCKMTFISKRNLTNHERSHTVEKPLIHKLFGEKVGSWDYLLGDGKIHSVEKPFKCKYCRKRFHSRSNCTVHEITHTVEKPFKCQYCEKTFALKLFLANHKKIHFGEKPFSCKYCGKQFRSASDYTAHKRIHSAENQFKCKFCEKKFDCSESLVYHERIHSGEKPFSCKYCRKQFRLKSYCTVHERIHTGEKPFTCKCCGKKFGRRDSLVRHERIHTAKKTFNCKFREEMVHFANFRDQQNIRGRKTTFSKASHKRLIKVALQRIPTDENFECRFCPKEFNVKKDLECHESVHRSKMSSLCQYCGRQFSCLANLIIHERIHTGEKPFKCDYCEKSFAHKGNLTAHKKIHSREKHFNCKFCGKKFGHRGSLVYHERIHTGDKPYSCQYCQKSFAQKGNLAVHKRIHSGEKSFNCKFCGKKLGRRDSLVYHERIHTGEKPFKCHYCQKCFVRKGTLKVHERIHTG